MLFILIKAVKNKNFLRIHTTTMKKYIYLIIILLLSIKAFAQGHLPGTAVPATPNTAPWNGYTVAPDYRQNASVTNAQSTALLPSGSSGTDIFANYLVDTTGYTFYLVYTTNGTVPTKTNGTVVNMSFAVVSGSNRIWAGKIPQQSAGTIVNYVIYVSTTGGTLAAANNRIASSRLGIQATWTEGDTYYSMITPGGVTNTVAWYKADTGLAATTWADQSGHNYNLTRTSAPAGSVTLNFNPVASFTGVTANHFNNTATKAAWPVGSNATTYYYVAKNSAAIANRAALGIGANGASTGFHSGQVATTGLISSAGDIAFTTGVATASLASPPDWDNTKSNQGINLVRTGYDSGAGRNYVAAQGSGPTNNTNNVNPTYTNTSPFRIGASGDNGIFWNGDVAEVIVFPSQHASTDYLKVETYLALKYGITKSGNYQLSNGTSVYNDATYNNNIAGIGRDDASTLNQKQSQSQNSGLQPVIGNVNIAATNTGNVNNFSTDLSALVWGSDTGSTSFATSFVFGGLNNRMTRIWKVQETGTVGTVKVALPVSQLAGNISSLNLVVSADAVFDGSDTRTAMTLETLGGVQYYTATVDFTSGQFFSFAAFVTAPGGVVSGLDVWLRGDIGLTGSTTWLDQSGNGKNLRFDISDCSGPSSGSLGLTRTLNFNKVADFASNAWAMIQTDISRVVRPNADVAIVYDADNSSTYDLWGTDLGAPLDERSLSTDQVANDNTAISYSGGNSGNPTINLTSFNGTISNGSNVLINGNTVLNFTGSTSRIGCNTIRLGDINGPNNPIDGIIGEFVVYNRNISSIERIRLNTYLGIKYGVTLSRDNDGDGTSGEIVSGSILEGDYVTSDGTTRIWNSDTTYQNNIAGIARDDTSALNQKQSQSINSGLQPVIGNVNITDTNANNTNNFSADLSALVWGSDTGSTSFATSFAFGGLNNRMSRIWRVQETGTVGTVKVALPVSQLAGNLSTLSLVVSADATFDGSDTRTAMTLETLGGVQYYTATVDFTSGQFFSFAALVTAPGGVLTNLKLWLKPDSGVTTSGTNVTTWTNQAPAGLSFTQGTVAKQPTLVSNYMNFNQGVSFATSGQEMSLSNGNPTLFGVNDPMSLFYLANSSSTSGARTIIEIHTGSSDFPTFEWRGTNFGMDLDGTPFQDNGYSLLSTVQANTPYIIASAFNNTNSGGQIYNMQNGASLNTRSGNTALSVGNNLFLGGNGSGEYILGAIPELIGYNAYVSNTTDIQKINTYLAVKYGVTLGTTVSTVNYLNSSGNVIWTGDTTYQNNIAGIARDDASALNQKQSQSVNTGLQPVIGNVNIAATNAGNTNNFSADLSSLVWGSDTGSTSFGTSFAFGGLTSRITRIWRVQETGTVGTVKIAIPASQITGSFTQLNLVVSADATFDGTDTRTVMTLETLGGVQYYTATLDFTTGQFFTFAAFVTAPGGVIGENLWYKADQGVTTATGVSQWNNLAQNAYNLSQGTAANQPVYNTTSNTINFNPSIRFDGVNDNLQAANVPLSEVASGSNPYASSHYIVYRGLSATTGILYNSATNAPSTWNIGSQTNGQVLITNRFIPTSAVSVNETRLQAFDGTSNTASSYLNGLLISSALSSVTGTSAANPFFSVGSAPEGASYSNADIAEIVVYNNNQPANRNRIETYLGLKYGLTLGSNSSVVNYTASNGSTIFWTGNTTYQNNIAGIARDDFSGLNQKQSQSVNSGLQPVIGNGNIFDTNANNTNNFSADLSALVWGSDTGSTSFATSFVFGGLNNRMARIWRVQETGTVGTVKVALPASQITANLSSLSLVVSADATFDGSDTRTAMTLETLGGVQYYTATVDFTTGQFFTFAAFTVAPGGVTNGLTLWMNPDAGIDNAANISTWTDQINGVVIPRKNTNTTLSINTTLNFNRVVNMPTTGSNGFELPASNSNITRYDPNATDGMSVFGAGVQSTSWNNYGALLSKTDGGAWDNGWVMSTTNISGSNWGLLYVWGNESGTGVGNSAVTSSGSLIRGNAFVASGWWDPALTNKNNIDLDAAFSGSINVATTNSVGSPLGIGYAQGNAFGGQLGDQIYYNRSLSSTERARVQSYLSVKFGTTLGTNALPFNYLNSSGSTIWTGSATYQNNIAGIARDDASGLNQKQSQSVLSGLQPVIGNVNITDTNANNTNNFSADLSALVWGSDTGSTSFATSFIFGGLNNRMARIWRVQETGTVGTVKVALPVSQVQGNAAQLNFVVSADATFDGSDTRTAMTLETLGGVQYYTATVDFTTGQFFTFAALATAPGGVFANLRIWLKADDGFTPSSWADRSGNSNDFTQTNASRQPNLIAAGTKYNFNPTVNFGTTGSDARFMVVPSGRPFTANGLDGTFLLTINQNTNSGFRDYLGFGNTTTGSGLTDANLPVFTSNDNGSRTFRIFPYSGATSTTNLQLTAGTTYISDVTWRAGVAGGITYGLNGFNGTSSDTFAAGNSLGFNGAILGSQPEVSDAFMSEVIAYERALTAAEMQRVRTYLSIKYGTTLDQSTAQNYLASDGTTIFWNATTNATYKNNIAGIGRDDTSALNQKQSQSINSGLQPVIGNVNITDTNANNTNNFSADLSALVWGSDTGSTSFATSFAFGGLNNRMSRIWRVQETGTVGTVKVALPVSQLAGNLSTLSLVVSADATFDGSDTRTAMTLETLGGVQYYTATVDFTSGQFFSFAAFATAPGGVFTNLSRWYKADLGASASTWIDQTSNGNATQGTVANQPSLNTSGSSLINFNSSLTFNSSESDYMSFSDAGMASGNSARSIFGVARTNVTGGTFEWISSYGTSTASQNFGLMRSANNILVTAFGQDFFPYSSNNPYANNTPVLSYGSASGTTIKGTYNALPIQSGTFTVNTVLNVGRIGTRQSLGEYWNGIISEVIYYNMEPSVLEKQRIDSYLGLKYGTSLGSVGSPFTYIASDGSTAFWTGDTTYQNNIAGIARDDASGLTQKQSQSVNSGLQPVIGNVNIADTNANNTNNFAADLSSLVWGSDTGSTSFATSFVFGGLTTRMTRIWRVQETGTVGIVKVALPASQLSGSITQLNLLTSADATFDGSDTRTAMTLETLGGVQYYTATVDFTSGQFFSFAAVATAPGGVFTGLKIWHKADSGITSVSNLVTAWNNAVNNRQAINAGGTQRPTLVSGSGAAFNFNPYLDYTSATNVLYDTGATPFTSDGDLTYFVSQKNITGGQFLGVNSSPSQTGNTSYDNFQWFNGVVNAQGSNLNFSSSALQSVLTFTHSGSSNAISGYRNSSLLATNTSFTAALGSGGYTLGGDSVIGIGGDDGGATGNFSEHVAYDRVLSASELLKVESYLAIKYGTTKTGDYQNSASTVIWTNDAAYQNNVFGISRDDISAQHQRISKSVNSGSVLTLSTDTNFTNENSTHAAIGTDLQSLVIGETTGAYTFTGTALSASGITFSTTEAMAKRWKVQDAGGISCINLRFDATSLPALSGNERYYLIVSDDANFTSNVVYRAVTRTGNNIDVSVNFRDNNVSYFTLAKKDLGISGGDLTDVKSGISTIPSAAWKPTLPNTYLEINSNSKGLVVSRVANTAAIASPIEGMIIYDLSDNTMKVYTGTIWRKLGDYSTGSNGTINIFCN